jgi:Holliday junction DNA helicase RuvA
MIASLRGTIGMLGADYVVLETGGVGFLVYAPRPVLAGLGAPGHEVFLHTLLIVREDALTLYGFATLEQRSMFETLLSVTGVGPRVALALLSAVPPDEVRLAVARNDTARFTRVSGIGKKMAERLALELKGKLDLKNLPTPTADSAPAGAAPAAGSIDSDLADLLVSLGYSSSEASAAIATLPPDAPTDLEARLRLALRYFGSA